MTALADLPELMKPEEARPVLRVGKNQLYEALRRGDIPAIRVGRSWRIPKHSLLALLNADDPAVTGSSESSDRARTEDAHG